jgi:hypothetical protein
MSFQQHDYLIGQFMLAAGAIVSIAYALFARNFYRRSRGGPDSHLSESEWLWSRSGLLCCCFGSPNL